MAHTGRKKQTRNRKGCRYAVWPHELYRGTFMLKPLKFIPNNVNTDVAKVFITTCPDFQKGENKEQRYELDDS